MSHDKMVKVMKVALGVLVVFGVVLVVIAANSPRAKEKLETSLDKYHRIKKGMSLSEVEEIMGRPPDGINRDKGCVAVWAEDDGTTYSVVSLYHSGIRVFAKYRTDKAGKTFVTNFEE
jgi:hypothetical protein